MKKYTVNLKGKQLLANDTVAFIFNKPKGFFYKAGQFIKVYSPNASVLDDDKDGIRYFAISSPPMSNEITIAYRMTESLFKDDLESLNIGSEIEISGPYGNLLGNNDLSDGIVFLVGGIGITTAHSVILDMLQRDLKIPMWLFLSNHTTMDSLWYRSLRNLSSPYLKTIWTMTRPHEELNPWAGNTDHINVEMIKKYIVHLRRKQYIILGQEGFVKHMKGVLSILGIPRNKIRARVYVY